MDAFEKQLLLLVEDSPDDVFLTQRALEKAEVPNPVQVVSDGQEAIAYLKGEGPFSDRAKYPLPIVVLLDLNMPRMNGFEVLEWLRSQPTLKRLVVIILTASSRAVDVDRAYNLGANFYLVKTSRFDQFVAMAKSLHGWLRLNHFPSA